MSRPFTHGTKHQVEHVDARLLYFSDRRTEAQALDYEIVELVLDENAEKAAWEKVRDAVLSKWIELHPGTRPSAWWRHDCPRSADGFLAMRRHLSGAGHPACEGGGFGIVTCWSGFRADRPPVFEAESDFLKRHHLLAPGEEARCDFSPITIADEREFTYRYSRYEIAGVPDEELIGGY